MSITTCTSMGTIPQDEYTIQFSQSRNWDPVHEVFINKLNRVETNKWKLLWKLMTEGSPQNTPEGTLPMEEKTAKDFSAQPKELHVTWLGHSTMILEIDSQRFLIDPVWSERASPFGFAGPKRFHKPPMPMSELLKIKIDAVVISHDHYDHLDYDTMLELKKTNLKFVVPLGVGSHLRGWGIADTRIVELDWWENHKMGNVLLTATPARHFSGRSLTDRDKTLWASWAFSGIKHRAFYSGDTAMFGGFKEIGDRLGPFDLTMLEVGAYNQMWVDVHMGPEQAVLAHKDLQGKVMLPVHWGTFDLALHAWTEPMERTLAAAKKFNVTVITPKPGQGLAPNEPSLSQRWWPTIPWQTALETPIVSTGLERLSTNTQPLPGSNASQ